MIGDGLHNLLSGLAMGTAFIVDHALGLSTWLAAAGNFVYIAASDLVPEVNEDHGARRNGWHTLAFLGRAAAGIQGPTSAGP